MFIDRAKVILKAGKGGDGSVSFRREKYVEFGGPDGGNGGKGGSIYLVSKGGIDTLSFYRHAKTFKAEPGDNGHKKNSFGRYGKDMYLTVPTGTVVYSESGEVLFDFYQDNMVYLACKGGRGGKGNRCFVTSTNRAPKFAENGEKGEEKVVYLELKLLADCGFVGLPSVGKSTLLSVISNAKPKIAAYKFTTLEPMLGVVELPSGESFVAADLPGLIEGASKGRGLGFIFLRHIERCRVILHVVDAVPLEGSMLDNFEKINKELESYNLDLLKRPMVICINKMDEEGAEKNAREFIEQIRAKYGDKYPVFTISAINREGLIPMLRKVYELLSETEKFVLYKPSEEEKTYVYNPNTDKGGYQIVKRGNMLYEIVGDKVKDVYNRINLKSEEGEMRLISYLNSLNIEQALEKAGVEDGATVYLDDYEFEYFKG